MTSPSGYSQLAVSSQSTATSPALGFIVSSVGSDVLPGNIGSTANAITVLSRPLPEPGPVLLFLNALLQALLAHLPLDLVQDGLVLCHCRLQHLQSLFTSISIAFSCTVCLLSRQHEQLCLITSAGHQANRSCFDCGSFKYLEELGLRGVPALELLLYRPCGLDRRQRRLLRHVWQNGSAARQWDAALQTRCPDLSIYDPVASSQCTRSSGRQRCAGTLQPMSEQERGKTSLDVLWKQGMTARSCQSLDPPEAAGGKLALRFGHEAVVDESLRGSARLRRLLVQIPVDERDGELHLCAVVAL